MKYELPLIEGTLIKRYKRFLADVRLQDGSEITVHCPNTGSMKRCAEPGSKVWISDSANPKRKYRYTWEWVEVDSKYRVCVNTARPNQIIGEALEAREIESFDDYESLQREPKVEDGRLDFCQLLDDGRRCWIEVKSVTLLEEDNGLGCFPDAVTDRGRKHLLRLQALKEEGDRAVLLFCVPHEGIREVTVAEHIDPKYAATLREVMASGVEVMAAKVTFAKDDSGLEVSGLLPLIL
ncbi:MAG: DNA/RNA nuclease SfsA [Oceanospirillaceae bacterium]|nr:DNA/RNA nuclease SfsA [Oceanospirillaceae bacterium]